MPDDQGKSCLNSLVSLQTSPWDQPWTRNSMDVFDFDKNFFGLEGQTDRQYRVPLGTPKPVCYANLR